MLALAIAENQVDGKTLCDLTNADLFSKIEDGGLGDQYLEHFHVMIIALESPRNASVHELTHSPCRPKAVAAQARPSRSDEDDEHNQQQLYIY